MTSYPKGSDQAISENFKVNEFDCPCKGCKETVIDDDLITRLETLRKALGCPLKITSGFRCANHQAELRREGYETAKGVSQHELGRAADVMTEAHTGDQIEALARRAGFRAVGVGKHFVHLDLRADKDRRWTYSY